MQTTVVRIANRLNIFHILVKRNAVISGSELSQMIGTDQLLTTRLLRYLVAMGAVKETGVDSYAANNITKNLTVPALEAGVNFTYDLVDKAGKALPSFLAKPNYRNPTDPTHCPFNDALSTKETLFEWFPKHPEYLQTFNIWMTGQRDGRPGWLEFFPFEERVSKGFQDNGDSVVLVDIGGAFGHEVETIKAKHPKVEGRFILQDLPDTIKQAKKIPGMEVMPHDFFTPEPVKGLSPQLMEYMEPASIEIANQITGARAYYLRNILHDWPDDKCIEILSHIASAMTKGYSKILLNEFVIPDQGASLIAAQLDITMMVMLAGVERTESQFKELVKASGLKIAHIWGDDPDTERVLELELA